MNQVRFYSKFSPFNSRHYSIEVCYPRPGVRCITEHAKSSIVYLDMDMLNTAIVAIHNAHCNPELDPIENRFSCFDIVTPTQVIR